MALNIHFVMLRPVIRFSASLTVAGWLLISGCEGPPGSGDSPPANFQELAATHLPEIEGELSLPGLKDEVEVLRDPWGVPHIYAQNLDDLFFAQGFVQAQDRLFLAGDNFNISTKNLSGRF